MRYGISFLPAIGRVSATAGAPQTQSGGTAAGGACALLTRDLVMKVSTEAGRKALAWAKPDDSTEHMSVAKGASVCSYGSVLLVLDPFGKPEEVRKKERARTEPSYKDYEPVEGVGDEAYFYFNSAFANLDVWTGSRHFSVQMGGGFEDEGKAMKPNVIALAKAVVPQLR